MGQTLTYGVYLPDEGERNCYSGLAQNWRILDDAVGAIAGKANASHTHGNITNDGAIGSTSGLPVITGTDGVLTTGAFGNTAGTFCEGNDSRLSDARTPLAHTHGKADITDLFNSANVWTGDNTFQGGGIVIKDTSAVSAGGYGAGVFFRDYQGNRWGYIQPYVTSDNYKNIIIGADGTGRIQLNSYLVPYAANAVNLGTSDLQWNNLYAKNYYYNGTQWGLDVANTWTGANVFQSPNTNLALQSTVSELGSLTSSSNWLRWLDKNGAQNTYISRDVWNDGEDTLRIAIIGKRANGAPSTSGTETDCGIRLNIAPNGTKSFTPFDSNINLGTSLNQWKSVYSQTYFYNGVQWGLDQANVWQTMQIIKQDTIDITTNPSAEKIGNSLYFYDGSRFWAQYIPVWGTDGSFRMELAVSNYTTSGGQGYWAVANRISKDFTTFDFYTSHNNANLGTSTNKWRTLNGINPGALSLPNVNAVTGSSNTQLQDISGDLVQDQYFNCYFTPRMDGWAYIALNCSNATIGSGRSSYTVSAKTARAFANAMYTQAFTKNENAWTELAIFFPVTANKEITLEFTFTGFSVTKAYVIPCLGNV